MKLKLLLLISAGIALFSCAEQPGAPLYPLPILYAEQGRVNGYDLSVYKAKPDLQLQVMGAKNAYSVRWLDRTDSLYLDPLPSAPVLSALKIVAAGDTLQLLVRLGRTVEHTFRYPAKPGISTVVVMGGFNDWSRSALPLTDEGDGRLARTVYLKPERHEYKFVVDGRELLDPANPDSLSNNMGGWNSLLHLSAYQVKAGGYFIKLRADRNTLKYKYMPASGNRGITDLHILNNNKPLDPDYYDFTNGKVLSVSTRGLVDGQLKIAGLDDGGRVLTENVTLIADGAPLDPKRNPCDWHFAVLYSLMTDRFLDGDPANNAPSSDGEVHPLADFQGGDFAGVIAKLKEGYFKDLGLSAIWLSPVQRQPAEAWVESIPPKRKFTGYHGYWPVAPRQVDPRFGTEAELKRLVKLAHGQGIKVILDLVTNHIHQEHPYFREHRDWFGQVELPDGTLNIRNWGDETRLTTWFDTFLPSYDYLQAPEAIEQAVADAIWWLETFDFDGFRQDAVKHVPHLFWRRLTAEMKMRLPQKTMYQIGESFGSDELIGSYVNPGELDAQFNFSIYFPARGLFFHDEPDFSNVKKMLADNIRAFGPVNLMGNITSSHDQGRFMGFADGQVDFGENGTERAFTQPPAEQPDSTSYGKHANFHAFNLALPGVPVVYYGEEIGMLGAGDPDNRRMMRFDGQISECEERLRQAVAKLVRLRREYPALSIGDIDVLRASGPVLVMARHYFDETIITAFNNGSAPVGVPVQINVEGSRLTSLLDDSTIEVADGATGLKLPPYSHQYWLLK